MRVNERIEELKQFFHGREEVSVFHMTNFANKLAESLKIETDRYPGVFLGSLTDTDRPRLEHSAYGISLDKQFDYNSHVKTKNSFQLFGYRDRRKQRNRIDFHVPLAYFKGGINFHATTITTKGDDPLLTIAKTNNPRETSKVMITSHSTDGHRLAEVLTRRLNAIAAQFRDEEGKKLPVPEITLVKGETVNLPEEAKNPTRREVKLRGLAAINANETLSEAFGLMKTHQQTAIANAKAITAQLEAERNAHEQTKAELEKQKEALRKKTEAHDALVKRLGKIHEATQVGFGKRAKAIEAIKKLAKHE